jgi:hypothetical protein
LAVQIPDSGIIRRRALGAAARLCFWRFSQGREHRLQPRVKEQRLLVAHEEMIELHVKVRNINREPEKVGAISLMVVMGHDLPGLNEYGTMQITGASWPNGSGITRRRAFAAVGWMPWLGLLTRSKPDIFV